MSLVLLRDRPTKRGIRSEQFAEDKAGGSARVQGRINVSVHRKGGKRQTSEKKH